jgi:hypothetical protein
MFLPAGSSQNLLGSVNVPRSPFLARSDSTSCVSAPSSTASPKPHKLRSKKSASIKNIKVSGASGANATDGTVRKPAFPPVSTGLRGYQMSDSHH